MTWRAGAASSPLPVAVGAPLAGYGPRTAPASGVLRPLEVNALALSGGDATGGDATVVVVTLDLLAVDAGWVRALRARLTAEHQLRPESVMVAASHTHAGPAGFRRVGATSPLDAATRSLRRCVLDVATRAVRKALADEAEVSLRVGTATCSVAAHRSDPSLPVDQRLTRVDVCAPDERLLAVLWHFACHPTVLGPDSSRISPDLPGEVRAHLRDGVREDLPVLFLNGAAGDVSTRFTRRAQTPDELRRLGTLVARAMPEASRTLPPTVPAGRTSRCRLPTAIDDHGTVARRLDHARAVLREAPADLPVTRRRVLEIAVLGLEKRLARAAPTAREARAALTATLQLLDLGDLALVGVPGELFSCDGARIRDSSRSPALVVGYAGDYLGYLPPTEATEGYEADSAIVAAGAGGRVALVAGELLATGGGR